MASPDAQWPPLTSTAPLRPAGRRRARRARVPRGAGWRGAARARQAGPPPPPRQRERLFLPVPIGWSRPASPPQCRAPEAPAGRSCASRRRDARALRVSPSRVPLRDRACLTDPLSPRRGPPAGPSVGRAWESPGGSGASSRAHGENTWPCAHGPLGGRVPSCVGWLWSVVPSVSLL